MGLLNTTGNLELKIFVDRDLEPDGFVFRPNYDYPILSHRWESNDEEIDFEGILLGSFSPDKNSWHKINGSRHEAQMNNVHWVWVDTCCIDKRSSAETHESTDSIFRWYERSLVCYVYLRDVLIHDFEKLFAKSERFTRGWTLQVGGLMSFESKTQGSFIDLYRS